LAEWWCRYILPSGGVLVDPFCGSGTTLLAALNCGASQVIGIDKDEGYLEIARRRLGGEIPIADPSDGQQIEDLSRECIPAGAS
jgi:DNA modification methylase